jgi:tRNA-splicing ligase RtcB (3'-phosphate/5'-hydroxy nucleic acid ligase)
MYDQSRARLAVLAASALALAQVEREDMPTLSEDKSVLSWASTLEPQALMQAQTTASMPFVNKPLALMPDAHLGRGSTIGSVIATEGAIIPSAVGVDIGCGMAALKFNMTSHHLPLTGLGPMMAKIREVVPAGVGQGHEARDINVFDFHPYHGDMNPKQIQTAQSQFGSLGSGNHFVELCLDDEDGVWLVLHSGSRGIGNQLASHHIEKAKGLMKQWFIELPDPDLAYFPQGVPEFKAYIDDLRWAQEYALLNRARMMDQIYQRFIDFLGFQPEVMQSINCHHNFTQMENHHGRNMWITRKGAIQAREGEWGIIPGSMGTRSYIVKGKGSKASYQSCSHGAGRAMSRTVARKTLSIESLQSAMEGKMWNSNDAKALLDEHPEAYKDIDQVMLDQQDLVEPVYTLRQILNYKGTK